VSPSPSDEPPVNPTVVINLQTLTILVSTSPLHSQNLRFGIVSRWVFVLLVVVVLALITVADFGLSIKLPYIYSLALLTVNEFGLPQSLSLFMMI
jgi:hypothetical protein